MRNECTDTKIVGIFWGTINLLMICSYLIFPLSFIVIMAFFFFFWERKSWSFLFVGFVCLRLKCRNTVILWKHCVSVTATCVLFLKATESRHTSERRLSTVSGDNWTNRLESQRRTALQDCRWRGFLFDVRFQENDDTNQRLKHFLSVLLNDLYYTLISWPCFSLE